MAVVRVTAVSAGAVDYLLRGSGCVDHRKITPGDQVGVEYQLAARGEPAGRWLGSGLSMIGVEGGSVATEEDVRAVFGRLEALSPRDAEGRVVRDEDGAPVRGEALGRPPRTFVAAAERGDRAVARARARDAGLTPEREAVIRARADADQRKAVAYYDVTFSPDKSVSVYWAALHAAGLTELADAVAAAHDEAVTIAARYLEEHVAYTRGGRGGVAVASVQEYQRAEGLVMIPFRHSVSRENEPQLHTHLGVLNRVVSRVDGKIRALDGQGFAPVKEAASEVYEAALAQLIERASGARMELGPDGVSRRIVGVDEALCRAASSRRADVVAGIEDYVGAYVATHGREPGPAERREMAQQAVFDTRQAKQGPGGVEGFRAWMQQHGEALAGVPGQVAEAAATRVGAPLAGVGRDGRIDWAAAMRAGIADVQAEHASWNVGNLALRVGRHLPLDLGGEVGGGEVGERGRVIHERVAAALADGAHGVVALGPRDPAPVPAELAHDGHSKFRPPLHADRYATTAQLATEATVVAATRTGGAPRLAGPELEMARVELAAAGLGPDQVAAVAGILSSGRRADVLIGPAGTGKSHTVAELARVWSEATDGRVLGLATSEIATRNLREDGLTAVNTSVFLGRGGPRVGPEDLVVIDEAAMSTTPELAVITERVAAAGGKLVYTGDHHQLTAVGAGGMLAQLAQDAPAVFELTEVRRFHHAWEREASLGLRRGDPAAVAAYADHGRLRAGTLEDMADAACRGWLADTVAGREALLVVATNADAAVLSARLRTQLIAYGRVSAQVIARDADGNPLGVGDLVQARRNDRRLRIDPPTGPNGRPAGGPVGMVTNRETYRVIGKDHDTGALRVARADGAIAHLPAAYLGEHTHLAYASTVHAAQGRTVDTGHSLVGEHAGREDSYTAATRGREANTLYLVSQRRPDEHQPERLDQTARAALIRALGVTAAEPTAEMTRRAGEARSRSLAWIGGQWDQVRAEAAEVDHGQLLAARLGEQLGVDAAAGVVDEPGYRRLLRTLRGAELAGHDPDAVLGEALAGRGLGDAGSVSDVLRWRIQHDLRGTQLRRGREPERQVEPGDWTSLATPLPGPAGQYAQALAQAATARQAELGAAAAIDRPAWAVALGPVPDAERDPGGRARWQTQAGIVAGYRELAEVEPEQVSLGPAPSAEVPLRHALYRHGAQVLGYEQGRGVELLADAQLYQLRERWTREQAWAPEWVADELASAYQTAAAARQNAELAAARLAVLDPDADGREWLTEHQVEAQRTAQAFLERAEQLEIVHQARAGWAQDTAEAAVADRQAGEELERRGLPLQRTSAAEQLPLFTTSAPPTGAADDPARASTAEASRAETASAEMAPEQLALLHIDPRLADTVAAAAVRDDPIDRPSATRPDTDPAIVSGGGLDDEIQDTLTTTTTTPDTDPGSAPVRDRGWQDAAGRGRDEHEQPLTVAEGRRQALAAEAQRAIRQAAAIERHPFQQTTRAVEAEQADQARRAVLDRTRTDPTLQAGAARTPGPSRGSGAPNAPDAPALVRRRDAE